MPDEQVALASSADAAGLDEDMPLLLAALRQRGIAATEVVWDDPSVDWSRWPLVVLRATWDYTRRHEAFVAWATKVAAVTTLRNPASVVTWNTHKRYLLDLAEMGVAVVPSVISAPGDHLDLPDDGPFVIKPAVSAGAQDTTRYGPEHHADAAAHVARLHAADRDVLVQPYLEAVDADGETAVIFLGEHYSHAIRKGPLLGHGHATVGGLFVEEDIQSRSPSARQRQAAEQTLDALPFARSDLLYARVDLLTGTDGEPRVLEVELVEPSLFLRFAQHAAERFAAVIADAFA